MNNFVKFCAIPLCSILVLGGVGFGIFKSIKVNSLPTCDSEFAKNAVINIFTSNNPKYNKLLRYNIPVEVEFSQPVPQNYNKEINKYTCSADVTIRPLNQEGLPDMIVSSWQNSGIPYGCRYYRSFNCNIDYEIYKSKEGNRVSATYCSDGMQNEGYIKHTCSPL